WWNGPTQLAIDVLARRRDLPEVAAQRLAASTDQERQWGRFLVRQFGLAGAPVLDQLRARLNGLANNDSGELSEICRTLGQLGVRASPALPELEAAHARVK